MVPLDLDTKQEHFLDRITCVLDSITHRHSIELNHHRPINVYADTVRHHLPPRELQFLKRAGRPMTRHCELTANHKSTSSTWTELESTVSTKLPISLSGLGWQLHHITQGHAFRLNESNATLMQLQRFVAKLIVAIHTDAWHYRGVISDRVLSCFIVWYQCVFCVPTKTAFEWWRQRAIVTAGQTVTNKMIVYCNVQKYNPLNKQHDYTFHIQLERDMT